MIYAEVCHFVKKKIKSVKCVKCATENFKFSNSQILIENIKTERGERVRWMLA